MNRTIQEQIVSILRHSGLKDGFWAEALLTTMHIIIMSSSRRLNPEIREQVVRNADIAFNEFVMHTLVMHRSELLRITLGNAISPLYNPTMHTKATQVPII